MSAEILRRAAEAIRAAQGIKFDQGRIDAVEFDTWIAVADLLDGEAANRDNYIRRQGWDASAPTAAELVARTYLGGAA